jgi:phosphatidate phosphatase APP1
MRRMSTSPLDVVNATAVRVAHTASVGARSAASRVAARLGWSPAAKPYWGYAARGRARVLGRVVMAPPGRDSAAMVGVPAWRRLLTLEVPDQPVHVTLDGRRQQTTTDRNGFVDTVVPADVHPGRHTVTLDVPGRGPVSGEVFGASPTATVGVVCDIDDTAWITGLTQPLRAAWRTFMNTSVGREPVPGMADLLQRVLAGTEHAPVVYLSNGPWNLARKVARFLAAHGFPPGALLMTDWGLSPDRWFRDGKAHKSSSLLRLAEDLPGVRFVLVGDDGEHDPDLYEAFARSHPDRVVCIALRQVRPDPELPPRGQVGDVPVLRGPDGHAILPMLDEVLRAASR